MNAMGARLVARYGQSRRFWRLRQAVRRTRFWVLSRVWRVRFRLSETSAAGGALRSFVRDTMIGGLIAVAVVMLLAVGAQLGRDLAHQLGLKALDGAAYDVLLETVAGTTGVFLALYFTAVSAIAATVYAAVPHDIRAVIVRDRLGNIYVRGVAFTMALAVLLLVAHAGGATTYRLALPIICFGALFSIFSFIRLGQRAFYLADPTLLANELGYQFLRWFDRAKHGGWRADEPAVQAHYRISAKRNVDSLVSLSKLASGQAHLRGESSRQLAHKISALLVRYLAERHRVPPESRWYGQRYEHPQWYLTDRTRLQLADATGALDARTVPDVNWVEADLLRPLMSTVTSDAHTADYEGVLAILGALSQVWVGLGSAWASEEGARWIDDLTATFLPAITQTAPGELEPRDLIPGTLDAFALVPLSLELGFHRSIVDRDLATLGEQIAANNWRAPDAAYAFSLPRPVVQMLEQIQGGLEFESAANGPAETRTPAWWIREMAMYSLEWAFHQEIEALVTLVERWYPATADTLTNAGLHEGAGAVLARGEELSLKLAVHLHEWERIAGLMRGEPRLDLRCPTWDWSGLRSRAETLRLEIDERLASSIVELSALPENQDVPDYLGHAVHRTGEACFDALATGDAERFSKLFPRYFLGILAVTERVRPRVTRYHPQQAVSWMAAPLMELLDIGGYALVYSELHGTPELWTTARDVFDRYFKPPDGIDRMKVVAAMYQHQGTTLGLTARSLVRDRWKGSLSNRLGALERRVGGDEFGGGGVVHESALIRRIVPDHGLLDDLYFDVGDILVVRYLQTLVAANGLDFGIAGWVARELRELDDAGEQAPRP